MWPHPISPFSMWSRRYYIWIKTSIYKVHTVLNQWPILYRLDVTTTATMTNRRYLHNILFINWDKNVDLTKTKKDSLLHYQTAKYSQLKLTILTKGKPIWLVNNAKEMLWIPVMFLTEHAVFKLLLIIKKIEQ